MFNNFRTNQKPLILWGVVTLFFAFQFILRLSVGILREEIITRYQIDTIMFGNLAGFYYLGYSGMQIPFGIMLDKFNFRAVIILAIMVTVIGIIPYILAGNWYFILIGRFLIGAGSAAGFLVVAKVIKLFFKESYHPLMIGFSFTFGLLGAIFGGKPMKLIFDKFGFEQGFMILILFNIIIALIIFSVQDKKITRIEDQTQNKTPGTQDIFLLLQNPVVLIIGLSGGLMVGALEGFADVWAIPFFNQIYKFSLEDSIQIISFIYIGMCLGGPILASLANYIGSVERVIFLTNILTILIFIALFYILDWDFYLLAAVMLVLGILCCYQVLIFTKVSSLVDRNITGLAIALANCLNMSFGYLFHMIIGHLMQYGSIMYEAYTKYDYHSFVIGLSPIPIGCAIGQLGFFYLYRLKNQKVAVNNI